MERGEVTGASGDGELAAWDFRIDALRGGLLQPYNYLAYTKKQNVR